jgi:hypothetical protein
VGLGKLGLAGHARARRRPWLCEYSIVPAGAIGTHYANCFAAAAGAANRAVVSAVRASFVPFIDLFLSLH